MEEGHDVLGAGLDGQLTDQLSIKMYCFTSLNSFLNIVGVIVYGLCGWSMLFPLGDGAGLYSSRLKLRTPVTSFASCPIKLVLGLFDDFSDKNILKTIVKLIHMLEDFYVY